MPNLFELRVEIPLLSWLVDPASPPAITSEQVAVNVRKLVYAPDATDVWNLPVAPPDYAGRLTWEGQVPVMTCALPMPTPGEAVLYHVVILKTGATLDAEGKTRAAQLLPTEEELLFCVIGAPEVPARGPQPPQGFTPGIQTIVIPLPT
ncbi:MAG TPA: hypothetical protein VGR57_03825 [Ktedonobacterales bacterium]|nr:hypothetical protein [Ktedonobacterales bacterium]